MAKVTTAEQAISTGDAFLAKYYNFMPPITVRKEDEGWFVVFDVRVLKVQKVGLRIDSHSGAILEYDDLSSNDT